MTVRPEASKGEPFCDNAPFVLRYLSTNGSGGCSSIGCGPALHAEQHLVRILELVLDVDEEQHRILAVDDAVVVADCDVHHRRGDDLAVLDDRTLLDRVHAEDRAL